jgi:hypothetical protein
MSNTATVQASLAFANAVSGAAAALNIPTTKFTVTGDHYQSAVFTVPTTAGGTAIPLGGVGAGGWAFIQNNDPTNYVDILTATSGTAFLRIMPGEVACFRFNPGITAPAALAHTASVEIQYLFLDA